MTNGTGQEPATEKEVAESASKSLRDRIHEHYLTVAIGVAVAAAGLTFAVANYFHTSSLTITTQKHELQLEELGKEVADLKRRLSSIERGFGDVSYLDMRNFMMSDERVSALSEMAEYHSDGNFYARHDDNKWTYKKMSDLDFAAFMIGEEHPYIKHLRSADDLMSGDVHIWMADEIIETDGEGPLKRIFPYITVQVLPAAEVDTYFSRDMRAVLGKDITGHMLTQSLLQAQQFTYLSGKLTYAIKNVDKKDDAVYVQAVFIIDDVTVDGENRGKLYLFQEIISIIRQDRAFVLNIGVPTDEPVARHEYFGWVNDWLSDFVIDGR